MNASITIKVFDELTTCLHKWDGATAHITEKDFEANTEDEVKREVETRVAEQYSKVAQAVADTFKLKIKA